MPDNETSDITYANWLWMTLIGLTSLQKYDTNTKSWGEAHAQARFVIMNMLQQKVPELLTVREFVNQKDKLPDFELSIDRFALNAPLNFIAARRANDPKLLAFPLLIPSHL